MTSITKHSKRILLASLLAGLGLSFGLPAAAQMPPAGMNGQQMGGMMHQGRDPVKMQERMNKHAALMKQKLKLTADQEGAWSTFTASMKPPANKVDHKTMHAEMEKLTTPERIDKMKTLREQHNAEMDKHAEAVKTFYAVLTPEQKKVFDAGHMMRGGKRNNDFGMRRNQEEGKPQSPMMSKP